MLTAVKQRTEVVNPSGMESPISLFSDYNKIQSEVDPSIHRLASELLLGERMAQYELQGEAGGNGQVVRIWVDSSKDSEPRICVNLLSAQPNRPGGATEWTHNGSFVCPIDGIARGLGVAEQTNGPTTEEILKALGSCKTLLQDLTSRSVDVQCSAHGMFRQADSFEVGTDTGGQVNYVDSYAVASAKRGRTSVVVNQGYRSGGATGMDGEQSQEGIVVSAALRRITHYVSADPNQTTLKVKETFTEAYCENVASASFRLLDALQVTDKVKLVAGHYMDGGVAGLYLANKLRNIAYNPQITFTWTDHSNGALREDERGPYPGLLERKRLEMIILEAITNNEFNGQHIRGFYLPASDQLARGAKEHYSTKSDRELFCRHLLILEDFADLCDRYVGQMDQRAPVTKAFGAVRDQILTSEPNNPQIQLENWNNLRASFSRDLRALCKAASDGDLDGIREKIKIIAEKGAYEYAPFEQELAPFLGTVLREVVTPNIEVSMSVPAAIDTELWRPRKDDDSLPLSLNSKLPADCIEKGKTALVLTAGRTVPAKGIHLAMSALEGAVNLGVSNIVFATNVTQPHGADPETVRYCNELGSLGERLNKGLENPLVCAHPGFSQKELRGLARFASVGLQLQREEPLGMVAQQLALSGVPLIATPASEAARVALGAASAGGFAELLRGTELEESDLYRKIIDLESKDHIKLHQGGILINRRPPQKGDRDALAVWEREVTTAASAAVALVTHSELKSAREQMGTAARENTIKTYTTWDQQLNEIFKFLGIDQEGNRFGILAD